MPIETRNPATGKVVKTFAQLSGADLNVRLQFAADAFQHWKRTAFDVRAALLRRVADRLERDARDFGALMTLEMGKLSQAGAPKP